MIIVYGNDIDVGILPNREVLEYKVVKNKSQLELLGKQAKCVAIYIDAIYHEEEFSPLVQTKTTFYSSLEDLTRKISGTSTVKVDFEIEEKQIESPIVQEVPSQVENTFEQVSRAIETTNTSSIPSATEYSIPTAGTKPLTLKPTKKKSVERSVPVVKDIPIIEENTVQMKEITKESEGTVTLEEKGVKHMPHIPIPDISNRQELKPEIQVAKSIPAVNYEQHKEVPTVSSSDLTVSVADIFGQNLDLGLGRVTRSTDRVVYLDIEETYIPYTTHLMFGDLRGKEGFSLTNLKALEQENVNLKKQHKQLVSELTDVRKELEGVLQTYNRNIELLKEQTSERIHEANKTIVMLDEERKSLKVEIENNPINVYKGVPRAVTLKNRDLKYMKNVTFVCKGAGVSASSYYAEVQNMIRTKPAVYLDLTCNGLLSILNNIKEPYSSLKLATSLQLGGNKVESSVLYPSEKIQELYLFNYPLKEVLAKFDTAYGEAPIVIVLESVEMAATKTIISDLSRVGIQGSVLVEEKVNLVLTMNELPFFDTKSMSVLVLNATKDIQDMVEKLQGGVVNIMTYQRGIEWTPNMFISTES